MKTLRSIFLLVIICSLGCTSTTRLRTGHEQGLVNLNKRGVKKQALVTFTDSSQIQVENLRMAKVNEIFIRFQFILFLLKVIKELGRDEVHKDCTVDASWYVQVFHARFCKHRDGPQSLQSAWQMRHQASRTPILFLLPRSG